MFVRLVFAVALTWFVSSCDNDFFPRGYYDYQVARLLSGDSTKYWDQVLSTQNCNDSIRIIISKQADSLSISTLTGGNNCSFDSLYLGKAKVSSFNESLLSTDSISFASGEVWVIKSLTSENMEIIESSRITSYVAHM